MKNSKNVISIFNPSVSNFGSVKSMFRDHEIKTVPVTVGAVVDTKSLLICGVSGLTFDDEAYLKELCDWIKSIQSRGTQIIGICAGMQMLFDSTEEVNQPLIGLLSGRISKLSFTMPEVLTYIGFRSLVFNGSRGNQYLKAYFAHGYGLVKDPRLQFDEEIVFPVNDSQEAVAYFKKGNVLGFQFHPEKSDPNTIEFFFDKIDFGYAH